MPGGHDVGERRMFPARAGMNRVLSGVIFLTIYVPRPCGDEPKEITVEEGVEKCSPPARG